MDDTFDEVKGGRKGISGSRANTVDVNRELKKIDNRIISLKSEVDKNKSKVDKNKSKIEEIVRKVGVLEENQSMQTDTASPCLCASGDGTTGITGGGDIRG